MRSPAGVLTRWLVACAASVACFALLPASAAAHAELLATGPENGQLVQQAPDDITLQFSEDVEVPFGGIKVFGPDGSRLTTESAKVDGHDVRLPITAAGRGTYAVSWRAISADGHPVRGAFTFDVGEHGSNAAKDRALEESKSSRALGIAYGVARGVTLLGLLGAVGAAWFSVAVAPGWRPRWIVWMLATLLLGSVASYVLDAAIAGGFTIGETLHWDVLREQAGTVYGRAGLVRMLIAVLALLSVRWITSPWRLCVLGTFVLLGMSQSLAGHAVATDPVWLRLPLDMLHTLAACIWLGGLVQLWAGVKGGGVTPRHVVRYSNTAFVAVIVLIATGTYAAYTEIGLSMEGLTSTTYGRLVLGKTALYVVLLGFGAINRQRLVPALSAGRDGAGSRLARFVAGELALLMLVIALTAWLIGAVPARNQLTPPIVEQTKTLRSGGSLQMIIDPARAGSNEVHLYTFTKDQQQDDEVTELTFEGENRELDIDHLAIKLLPSGPGHFTTNAATIPFAGDWTFTATIRRGRFDSESTKFRARIARR